MRKYNINNNKSTRKTINNTYPSGTDIINSSANTHFTFHISHPYKKFKMAALKELFGKTHIYISLSSSCRYASCSSVDTLTSVPTNKSYDAVIVGGGKHLKRYVDEVRSTVCMYVCMHVYMCVVCMYVRMHVCVYIMYHLVLRRQPLPLYKKEGSGVPY